MAKLGVESCFIFFPFSFFFLFLFFPFFPFFPFSLPFGELLYDVLMSEEFESPNVIKRDNMAVHLLALCCCVNSTLNNYSCLHFKSQLRD